jgi:hypothetical protein
MSFPEGPLVQKLELAGGAGLEHICPHCGLGITRLDYEAQRDAALDRIAILEDAFRKACGALEGLEKHWREQGARLEREYRPGLNDPYTVQANVALNEARVLQECADDLRPLWRGSEGIDKVLGILLSLTTEPQGGK